MNKYYFIGYAGLVRQTGTFVHWHEVIDVSPMDFLKKVERLEEESEKKIYIRFHVFFCHEITAEEYEFWEDEF